jgi:hypothetical protein
MIPRGPGRLTHRRVWFIGAGEPLTCFGGHRLKNHEGKYVRNPMGPDGDLVSEDGGVRCRYQMRGRRQCPAIAFLIGSGFHGPDGNPLLLQVEVTAVELHALARYTSWREQLEYLDLRPPLTP